MKNVYFTALFLTVIVLPSFAYLDPGTGSMIISAVIGVGATLAYIFKGLFFKLFRLFKKGDN